MLLGFKLLLLEKDCKTTHSEYFFQPITLEWDLALKLGKILRMFFHKGDGISTFFSAPSGRKNTYLIFSQVGYRWMAEIKCYCKVNLDKSFRNE